MGNKVNLPYIFGPVHERFDQDSGTDTIVYARSGHGTIVFNNGKERHDLAAGDFAIIPA